RAGQLVHLHLGGKSPLVGGVSLVEVTERCALAAGWKRPEGRWRAPATRGSRGIGIAVSFKNAGFSYGYQENCWAKVELLGGASIEEALVYIGSAEVGQGTHTVIGQMAAEVLGLSTAQVQLVASDTASSPGSSGSVSASRMTVMASNAVRGAAERALEQWDDEARPAVAEYTYLAPKTTPFQPETGHGVPNLAYGYVAEAVEVEVDVETGQIRILRVVCVDDVGKAVNPELVEGQIEGGIAQALGWATCENLICDGGQVLTPNLSTYLIPNIDDMPEQVQSILHEHPDPRMPWGVRGMGEMPFIPFAPALAAAVHRATGVWYDELPLTPERVLNELGRATPQDRLSD
ncbi:xanthine dehydrogenase family protein molybdopterin-binding subunit, partial [Chloroflexota bacterium]